MKLQAYPTHLAAALEAEALHCVDEASADAGGGADGRTTAQARALLPLVTEAAEDLRAWRMLREALSVFSKAPQLEVCGAALSERTRRRDKETALMDPRRKRALDKLRILRMWTQSEKGDDVVSTHGTRSNRIERASSDWDISS